MTDDERERARCKGEPADRLGVGRTDPSRAARAQTAAELCAPCPVRAQCLAHARSQEIPHGIYGGKWFADGVESRIVQPRRADGIAVPPVRDVDAAVAKLARWGHTQTEIAGLLGIGERTVRRAAARRAA